MPPVNDAFADATAITGQAGDVDLTTVDATVEGSEPGALVASVWLAWTAPDPAPEAVAFGLDVDATSEHVLAIYSGATLAGLTLEDDGTTVDGSVDDVVLAAPVAAEVYRVQVGTADVGTGPGALSWSPYVVPEVAEEAVLDDLEDEADVPDDAPIVDPDIVGAGMLWRISETYPAPTLDADTGRPTNWGPETIATVEEVWGQVTIAIDGEPVRLVRGATTEISSLSWQEPFGEGPGQLLVRGATLWDKGAAGFEWLREEANVNIDHVDEAGDYLEPLWCGIVQTVQPSRDGWVLGIEGALAGPSGMMPHRPRLTEVERDLIKSCVMALRRAGMGQARRKTITEVVSGITTRDRGSRGETVLEYVNRLLGLAQLANGDQWTLARVLDGSGKVIRRKYGFRLKDRTTVDLTVRAGQRGVDVSGLRRDLADVSRLIMAEGVNRDGGRWRNTKLPNVGKETVPPYPGTPLDIGSTGDDVAIWQREAHSDGWGRTGDLEAIVNGEFGDAEAEIAELIQEDAGLPVTGIVNEATWDATWSNGEADLNLGGARFDPIVADQRVRPYLTSSNGSAIAANPDRDRSVLPIGRMVSHGQDTTKAQGRRFGRSELARAADASWYGQVTIDGVDPPQMSRLSIREGMNLQVLDLDDEPLLHIAGVRWSRSGNAWSVTLDVDEQARDRLTLAEIRNRRRDARQDPARMALAQLRRSAQIRDTPAMWDAEGGFGLLPTRDASTGWNVYKIAAGKYGSLSRVKVITDPDVEFAVALFGARVKRSWLRTYFPTPLADHGEETDHRYWDRPARQDGLRARLFIEAWGEAKNPGGYSPGYKTNPESGKATGHAITGRFDTDTSTDYALDEEPMLYVAIYVTGDTTVRGQIYLLPNE